MPRPVSDTARQELWQRAQSGEATPDIAADLGLNPRTARNLLGSFRCAGGPRPPRYDACGRPLAVPRQPAQALAVQLRRQHPGWGAGRIRLGLHDQGFRPAPPDRTIRRWLADAGLSPRPAPRPRADIPRAGSPHEVWQMDASEHIRLAGGQEVSWLRLVDECTGAVLWTAVFPPRGLGLGPGPGGASGAAPGLRPLGPARRPARR